MQNKLQSFFIIFLSLLFFCNGLVLAGTTGKIAGVVVDSQTNEPLPGVNIIVVGTMLGAASDIEGRYAILNVPPGIYELRAEMIGYTPNVTKNVRVKIDLTTTINFSLSGTVIGLDEVTVIAEREIVQMDMTSSLPAVGAEEIEDLPVQSVNEVLSLQAGVVQSGGEFHVRGGRGGEITYMVDGVPVTTLAGDRGITVESDAVQEMQLISGTFNAEYGNAMSAILNIVTKEGGNQYQGQILGTLGDYVSNNHIYEVMDSYETVRDPVTGTKRKVDHSSNPLKKLNPQYDFRATIAGPVPLLKNKVSFFVNGRYESTTGFLFGRRWFTPQGLPGDSALVPLRPRKSKTLQVKLTSRPISDMKVNYNVFFNSSERERTANKILRYVPDAGPQQYRSGVTHLITINHTLSPTTFYELKFSRFSSDFSQYLYKDPYKMPGYFLRITDPETNISEDRYYKTDEEKQAIIDEANEKSWRYKFYIDPNNSVGYLHPDSNSISRASTSFENLRTDLRHRYSTDRFWLAKFDVTSQISKTHQIKSGFEATFHNIDRENFTLRPKTDANGNEIVPFVPNIEPISSIWHDKYNRTPREFSAYVQDKMEYQDFILNIGVRFDYFDPNYVVPVDPSDPDIYNPFAAKFKGPDWDEAYFSTLRSQEEKAEYINTHSYTPEQRRELMHKKVKPKTQISPRIGIAYPITDKGVIHFSYGHFFQMPSADYLYTRPDFKLSIGSTSMIFGNADLEAEKTSQYEIGIQQQIGEQIGIDVTIFYKDIRDWVGISPPIETQFLNTKYYKYENKDYANVRGITVAIDRRFANNFAASLDYTFQFAEGTYTSPSDAYAALLGNQEPAKKLIYMDYDRRHSLNGTFSYRVSGWTIAVIGKFNTGFPYTPRLIAGSTTANYRGWRENIARNPSTSVVDLKIDKFLFRTSRISHRLFMRIYNLFDQKGALRVHPDTGSPQFTTYGTHRWIQYDEDRIGSIEHYYLNPTWYQDPRQIQLGYILEF